MNPGTKIALTFLITLAIIFIPILMYDEFGWFKFFYHDILRWHKPDDSPMTYDGCSIHAKCKYCGDEIMQDGQGNWF